MPTGYTSDIKQGITFEQFALNCARAFGACLSLRDLPGGGDVIPQSFEPSDYHLKKIDDLKKKLDEFRNMDVSDAYKSWSTYCNAEIDRRQRNLEESTRLIESYNKMLDQVKNWQPPTDDHIVLKEFMITQIEESIRFDDDSEYYSRSWEKPTCRDWMLSTLRDIEGDIAYHEERYQHDVAIAERNTKWIKYLRSSLKPKVQL
jgi:hypothetical protein